MQNRFTTFRRETMFYCEDRTTGQQKSLQTKDETEASKIVQAKNDAVNQPLMNLVMAKTYLAAKDPKLITRTPHRQQFVRRSPPRLAVERTFEFRATLASGTSSFGRCVTNAG